MSEILRRTVLSGLVALLLAMALAAAPAAAADSTALMAEVESQFRILRLRSGVVLEPRDDRAGIRTVEVIDGRFAIDGSDVDEAELRDRLGDAADAVVALAALDDAGLDALFESIDAGAMEVSEPAVAPAEPAEPPRPPRRRRSSRSGDDSRVVFGSELVIERDELSRDAVVFGGPLRVLGEVAGDAVAIGGSVRIEGRVSGDVAVIGGSGSIERDAEIYGNVVAIGAKVEIDDRATVHGEVIEVPFGPSIRFGSLPRDVFHPGWWNWGRYSWFDFSPWSHLFELMWRFFGLALLALLACLAWLLGRGPIERIGRRIEGEPWKSGLVGLAAQILFLPLVVLVILILTVSIIGIPLLLLVPFALLALLLVAFLGFVAVAHRLGDWSARRFGWRLDNPYLVLLVGLALLQVWSLLGHALDFGGGPLRFFAVMFLVFGALLKYVAWTVGFGGALLTRFGTHGGPNGPATAAAPVPPPPPVSTFDAPTGEAAERPFWEKEALEPGDDEERSPERG